MSVQQQGIQPQGTTGLQRVVQRLHLSNRIWVGIITAVTVIIVLGFIAILLYLIGKGFPFLTDPNFYGSTGQGNIGRQIYNTFYILIFAEIILIPISMAAAIYMVEYAKQGLFVKAIRFAAETLAGVPAIILGLFGYLAFSTFFGVSRMAGALTLLCLNLPLVLRLFEDALMAVPRELREGGLALGCTKWHVIRTVVLPSALPGIVTAIVLSMGKVLAESAALVFTMGLTTPRRPFTLNPFIGSDTLTVHIYYVQTIGSNSMNPEIVNAVAAGSAAFLVVVLLAINIIARAVGRLIQRYVTAA